MTNPTLDGLLERLHDPRFEETLARNYRDASATGEDVVAVFYAKFETPINQPTPANKEILEAMVTNYKAEEAFMSGSFFDDGLSYMGIFSAENRESVHKFVNRVSMDIRGKLEDLKAPLVGTASFIARADSVVENKARAEEVSAKSKSQGTHFHDYV